MVKLVKKIDGYLYKWIENIQDVCVDKRSKITIRFIFVLLKSQLLTDRSGPRRSKLAAASTNVAKAGKSGGSRVEENRRKIESQLEKAYAKGTKPSPNAVAVGRSNAANQENSLKNESFSSISEMDNEANSRRPKR